MKAFILIFLAFLLSSCQFTKTPDYSKKLSDKEWDNILAITTGLSQLYENNIYNEFDNSRTRDLTNSVYQYCDTILKYKINDSIVDFIDKRKSKPIMNKFDTLLNGNCNFITDTNNFDHEYMVYSEPFSINGKMICLSSTIVKPREKLTNHYVWFGVFNKNDVYHLLFFYNFKKDCFFRGRTIK